MNSENGDKREANAKGASDHARNPDVGRRFDHPGPQVLPRSVAAGVTRRLRDGHRHAEWSDAANVDGHRERGTSVPAHDGHF